MTAIIAFCLISPTVPSAAAVSYYRNAVETG
jgi:hypothetical protein